MREDAAQQADLISSARNQKLSITPGCFHKATVCIPQCSSRLKKLNQPRPYIGWALLHYPAQQLLRKLKQHQLLRLSSLDQPPSMSILTLVHLILRMLSMATAPKGSKGMFPHCACSMWVKLSSQKGPGRLGVSQTEPRQTKDQLEHWTSCQV